MMEREVVFQPGFDKRHTDPAKNCGIGGMRITFLLKGELGSVQFVVLTDWYPPETQKEYHNKFPRREYFDIRPMGADVGYHSPTPFYETQHSMECDILPGGKCYYDGSGLAAERVVKRFLVAGTDAVWSELEDYYDDTFGEFR